MPSSVRWVANQNSRWGSATPSDGTIRLSAKLQPMPQWVIDYVLLHELAHLLVAGHDAAFWRLLDGLPGDGAGQGLPGRGLVRHLPRPRARRRMTTKRPDGTEIPAGAH